MRTGSFVTFLALAGAGLASVPSVASAQYKNASVGLDLGGWLITKPDILTSDGEFKPVSRRPLRLSSGVRVGAETALKMNEDHWWFIGRFSVGFLSYAEDSGDDAKRREYDRLADETLGTLLGLQGLVGLRYVILTDRLRPYVQASFSYLRLFSFSNEADAGCTSTVGICGSVSTATSNASNFLPHPNVGTLHVEPGVEFIIVRDVALRFYADLQHWFVLNAEDNWGVVIGGGITFFT